MGNFFYWTSQRWEIWPAHILKLKYWYFRFGATIMSRIKPDELESLPWNILRMAAKSCTSKRMVETCWNPVDHGMFTTVLVMKAMGTCHWTMVVEMTGDSWLDLSQADIVPMAGHMIHQLIVASGEWIFMTHHECQKYHFNVRWFLPMNLDDLFSLHVSVCRAHGTRRFIAMSKKLELLPIWWDIVDSRGASWRVATGLMRFTIAGWYRLM